MQYGLGRCDASSAEGKRLTRHSTQIQDRSLLGGLFGFHFESIRPVRGSALRGPVHIPVWPKWPHYLVGLGTAVPLGRYLGTVLKQCLLLLRLLPFPPTRPGYHRHRARDPLRFSLLLLHTPPCAHAEKTPQSPTLPAVAFWPHQLLCSSPLLLPFHLCYISNPSSSTKSTTSVHSFSHTWLSSFIATYNQTSSDHAASTTSIRDHQLNIFRRIRDLFSTTAVDNSSETGKEANHSSNVQISESSDYTVRHGRLARLHARPVRL